MNAHTPLRALCVLSTALLTVACGGGGYGGGGSADFAGIDRTGSPSFGFAFGTISGFGSIIVNGVHYETDSSTFEIDDSPGSQDDLSVGDVVLVSATRASGSTTWTATSVIFDDNVEGPITEKNLDNTIVVLGQTVQIVDGETIFDNSFADPSFNGLNIDDIVEVTGYVGSEGQIIATRIEPKIPTPGVDPEFEITGIVDGLGAGSTFTINGLTVDYSSVLALQDFPGGVISVDDLVEAKGTAFDSATNTLTATFVEFKGDRLPGNADDNAEVEGLITRFGSRFDFDVYGIRVDATDAVFEGNQADIDNMGVNIKVEVEGTILEDANGRYIDARKVDVRRAKLVRIEATVDSVSADANDPRIGTFDVLGITVEVDLLTRMEDKLDNQPSLTLNDLTPNVSYVRMRGSVSNGAGTAQVLATLLERDDPRDDTELQGFVDSAANPIITILGVQINTSGAVFRDENDALMNQTDFFNRLEDELAIGGNPLIKAVGTESSPTTIDADEVEFEVEF